MSYKSSLEAAGATVLHYKEFGTYQGDWFAVVSYKNVKGLVHGAFGSCTGCDAFKAEMEDFYYSDLPENRQAKLEALGQRYLKLTISIEEAMAYVQRSVSWDLGAKDMSEWIKNLQILEFDNKIEDLVNK